MFIISWFHDSSKHSWISCSFILYMQVIESKEKDTNSSGDYSSSDAIRVSVLVCIQPSKLHKIH